MGRPTEGELYRWFDRSPIGMYRSTEAGRIVYGNAALGALLGYTVEELRALELGRDVYVDPEARRRLIETYRAGSGADGIRVEWKTKHGRRLIVLIYGHVSSDHGDEPLFDASVIDITQRELARQTLERTATILDRVLGQVGAIYWLLDREFKIIGTGGPIAEMMGFEQGRYSGKTLFDVRADDTPQTGLDYVALTRRAMAGETIRYENEYRGKQLDVTLCPYRVDGEIVGVIGTAVDVTVSRALERRMVDAQRAESLGVLAGGLAHDFNNLLVAILGNADLGLREIPAGSAGRCALENIRSASLRAAELTDQLLAYAGRGVGPTTRLSPRVVVDELLRISAPSMPANVHVDVALPDGLGIRGDASQIRQVVMNLIGNARDALGAEGGTITIAARLVQHAGDPHPDDVITAPRGAFVELEIADTGSGIDRETRRRIFEPFFTTKPAGHGLGLAAVLGIVRSHHGGLRLISAPGEGTRFVVLWPATTTPLEQAAVSPPPRTVLVIDDEDLVRDVVARMIEDLGYAALTAPDGATGLEVLEHQPVDAVLVDLSMPRMSGADLISTVKARRPTLPIVLCTGFDRDRRGPVDADAYLAKPFRMEALEQTLAKLLG